MAVILTRMIAAERIIGVRQNDVFLVFGQTLMMCYIVHRLLLTGSGAHGGLGNIIDLQACYLITSVFLLLLYSFCLCYRGCEFRHVASSWWLKCL